MYNIEGNLYLPHNITMAFQYVQNFLFDELFDRRAQWHHIVFIAHAVCLWAAQDPMYISEIYVFHLFISEVASEELENEIQAMHLL